MEQETGEWKCQRSLASIHWLSNAKRDQAPGAKGNEEGAWAAHQQPGWRSLPMHWASALCQNVREHNKVPQREQAAQKGWKL